MDTMIQRTRTRLQDRRAFTLIEMLTVLAIIAFIMGLSIGAFRDFGRGAGMRGSMLHAKSGFNMARQYAITHRIHTTIHYANLDGEAQGYYYIMIPTNRLVGTTNYLSSGVAFSTGSGFETNPVTFNFDGSCRDDATSITIGLEEWGMSTNGLTGTLRLNTLTGRIRSTISGG